MTCKRCGSDAQGRYCRFCKSAMRFEDMGAELTAGIEYDTPDYVDCNNCGGRAYVDGPEGRKDCPVCEGFGKVQILADGGLEQMKPPEHYGREALQLVTGMRRAVLEEDLGDAGEDMVVRIEETMARLHEDYEAVIELRELVEE